MPQIDESIWEHRLLQNWLRAENAWNNIIIEEENDGLIAMSQIILKSWCGKHTETIW